MKKSGAGLDGDSFTTTHMYLTGHLTAHLEMAKMANFMSCISYHN